MKYVLCFFLFLLLIIINPPKVDAQSVAVQNRYGLSFETTGLASTAARTPFWFQANQYGIVPTEGYFLSTRLGVQVNYQRDTTKKQIRLLDWGAGFYGVANVAKQPQLLLPEAYLKVRLGKIEAWGGGGASCMVCWATAHYLRGLIAGRVMRFLLLNCKSIR